MNLLKKCEFSLYNMVRHQVIFIILLVDESQSAISKQSSNQLKAFCTFHVSYNKTLISGILWPYLTSFFIFMYLTSIKNPQEEHFQLVKSTCLKNLPDRNYVLFGHRHRAIIYYILYEQLNASIVYCLFQVSNHCGHGCMLNSDLLAHTIIELML